MMRVRPPVVGIAFTGCTFTLLTMTLMTSRSLEDFIEGYMQVPMSMIPEKDAAVSNIGPKMIAWFDSYNNNHGLRNSVSNAKFSSCKGAAKNCKILPHVIVNRSQRVVVTDADAVIFQGCHLYQLTRPQRQKLDQIFVLAERENWLHNAYDKIESKQSSDLNSFKDAFNWTMTYRQDSDILFPYGEVKKSTARVKQRNFSQVFLKKKYDAVWFVSHCVTQSLREKFVLEMQKYITVHIYGKCGNHTCPRKKVERDSDNDCLKKVAEEYKFVFSFENSYRTNYVTEKLFDWFPRDIVPVVRGGGGDYTKYGIPEGTIIDADSYYSAKELALFLKSVGSNERSYTEYLKKKQGYYSISMDKKQTQGYCRLCGMLQNVPKYRKSYSHIGAWWDSTLFSDTYPDVQKIRRMYHFSVFCNLLLSVLAYKCLVRRLMHQRF